MAYTHGMYEKSLVSWQLQEAYLQEHKIANHPRIPEAEIVMIVSDKPSDATEGEGIKVYQDLDLHPNFDWRNMTSGFFATINGLPTYKFKAVPENGLFTKRVVEYGDRTEYTLFSPSGHETFINTSPASNMWVPGSSKSYTMGIELHVHRLDNICTHTAPPATFPVDIVNYLPIGVQIIHGKEKKKSADSSLKAGYC